jgi:hypothetical protein
MMTEAKWNESKVKGALWLQTKATRFGMMMDAEESGYNPRQVFRPLPTVWVQEPFGLNLVVNHDLRLRPKRENEPPTAKQWRARTQMARSVDPLNHWMAHYRHTTLPADGEELRSKPTVICYFASPQASLTTGGVYRDDLDHNLTDAYLRTTVSQFLHEMEGQVTETSKIAGAVCFGTRVIRTSHNTGFAFYKDPNQYIFNMAWVNCPELQPDEKGLSQLLSHISKHLQLVLMASHEVAHLILDASMLVGGAELPQQQVAAMIRDSILTSEFQCDQLTILWPTKLSSMELSSLLTFMWGEDDSDADLNPFGVDYGDGDDDMKDEDATMTVGEPVFDWRAELRSLGFSKETIDQYAQIPTIKMGIADQLESMVSGH